MNQETFIVYSVQSTEHDLENMLNQQEAFCEAELGQTYFAIKEELDIE